MPKQSELSNIEELNPDMYNIVDTVPLGILSFFADGKISFINKNFLSFGITKRTTFAKILDGNVFEEELFPGIDLKNDFLELKKGIPFEKIADNIKTLDGGEISIVIKAAPLYNNETFIGGVVIIEDIKIAKRKEAASSVKFEAFSDVFNAIFEVLLILDPDGNLRFIFGSKSKLFTDYYENSAGTGLLDMADIKSGVEFADALNKIKAGANEARFPLSFRAYPDVIFSAVASPFIEDKKNIKFILVRLSDLTEHITEKEKLSSEISDLEQFQAIIESIVEPICVIDQDGKIRFWNRPAQGLFEYTKSEVYGKNISKIFKVFDKIQFSKIKEELAKNNVWKDTVNVYKKDGTKEIAEAVFSHINNSKGNILIVFSNITERTEIEKALRSSEEMFRNIVTFSNELICNLEPDGTITYINPVFSKIFETTDDELIGKKLFDVIDIGLFKKNKFTFDVFLQKINNSFEFQLITKSKKQYHLTSRFYPVYNFDGSIKYYNAIISNITEKKEDEKKLLIIKSIFSASQNALSVIVDRKIILANEAFVSIFGYAAIDEVTGKDPLDFVSENDMAKVAGYIKAREHRKDTPPRYEYLGKKKDNSNFLLEALITSFEIENRVYIITEAHDITERKRAQQAIRESEEKYRSITENIDDFMWTAERIDGRLKSVFFTSSVEKIMGYSQVDFIKDPKLFLKTILPDDFAYVKKKIQKYNSKHCSQLRGA